MAAVQALRQGVTQSDLRRFCGVSPAQIERWVLAGAAGAPPLDAVPRVFSVVETPDVPAVATHEHDGAQELELRLNGWAVVIRRVAP